MVWGGGWGGGMYWCGLGRRRDVSRWSGEEDGA